jgi:hypothetical protein
MSRNELLAYVLTIRGYSWKRRGLPLTGLSDFRRAMSLAPGWPDGFNDFAWLIATRNVPTRKRYVAEALTAARTAVSLDRTPDRLDTLACAQALSGDFSAAKETESEAISGAGEDERGTFSKRRGLFQSSVPTDCTGE